MEFFGNLLLESVSVAAVLAAVLGFLGLIFRETILKYISVRINAGFEKEVELAKSEIRKKEREIEAKFAEREKDLERIAEFLSQMKKERSIVLLNKRIEAAENTLKASNILGKLLMAVETLKILNVDIIRKRIGEPKLQSVFKVILESMNVDENMAAFGEIDLGPTKLYLNDRARKCFDAYTMVITHPVLEMKFYGAGIDPTELLKENLLKEKLESLVPTSKTGFEKYGESYAYYWVQWLQDETIKELRAAANGFEQDDLDAVAATSISVNSQRAHLEARQKLVEAGLPEDLMISDSEIPEVPPGDSSA